MVGSRSSASRGGVWADAVARLHGWRRTGSPKMRMGYTAMAFEGTAGSAGRSVGPAAAAAGSAACRGSVVLLVDSPVVVVLGGRTRPVDLALHHRHELVGEAVE